MKKFRVEGTHRCHSLSIPEIPTNDLPSTATRTLGKRVTAYKPIPTTTQWRSLTNAIPMADYIQHRQQDNGRAIALGKDPTNALLRCEGNIWTFQNYTKTGGRATVKLYTVTWDGLGIPPAGVSTSTYSQGKTYTRSNGSTGHLQGKPDKYTWAVKWIAEGIPSDDKWLPIPSRWANYPYNAIAVWAEYDLSL